MSQMSIDSTNNKVLEFLKICPRTPTEIADYLKLSREHVTRTILKPLINNGKIVNIEGTHRYQLKGFSIEKKAVDRILAQSSKFDDCQTVKNWRAGNTSKKREAVIAQFKLICVGGSKYTEPNFRINPDSWSHPTDTEMIISHARKFLGTEQLPHNFRMTLRSFLIYGLKYQLLEAESLRLGIPLPKGKPTQARLECTPERYTAILDKLESDVRAFCVFGFSFGTFCRPSSRYIVKCTDLEFFDRQTEYFDLGNGIIETDPDKVKGLTEKYQIKPQVKIQRAINVEILENKTGVLYPKVIFDERVVKKLEKYCSSRTNQGFTYLFWDNNKTNFTFENYDTIVASQRVKDGKLFSRILKQVGFVDGDFGKSDRANYAIRHFGVQDMLQKTDYDYGTVAEMGWDDIETLRSWYGKMTPKHRLKALSGVFFN